jgi:hypothetical protein
MYVHGFLGLLEEKYIKAEYILKYSGETQRLGCA